MEQTAGSSFRLVGVLIAVMTAVIISFVLFEQQSTSWITSTGQSLGGADGTVWLVGLFIVAVLAFDVVLPIPSSIVAVLAASTLGFWAGSLVIWLGLMGSCLIGYSLGAGSERFVHKWVGDKDLAKARRLADRIGPGLLVTMRGVPVLAETSVIAAGLVRYPFSTFILICALANAGLALAFGYVGSAAGEQQSMLWLMVAAMAVPAGAWLVKVSWQYIFHGAQPVEGVSQQQGVSADGRTIDTINAEFDMHFHYPVLFENNVFALCNPVMVQTLARLEIDRFMVFVDAGVAEGNPQLCDQIKGYFDHHGDAIALAGEPVVVVGGEAAKHPTRIDAVYQELLSHQIDRHNGVIVIGGGAVLDAVGYACTTFHRGVKLVRMPSTTLAQNDAGVGVKNGFNFANTKNLIGTFSPPTAVINDAMLLQSLSVRDRRAGLAEAVKVAAIRDGGFFRWMEENAAALSRFEATPTQYAIARCAELHIKQITGAGDPFESGSARPLDYGHWSAHKLEAIAQYGIRHGEAVAIGMALDARYAVNVGLLAESEAERLVKLLENLGFELWHDGLNQLDDKGEPLVFAGLEEFRQHLGGDLCVTLLSQVGVGEEVGSIDRLNLHSALGWLKARAGQLH